MPRADPTPITKAQVPFATFICGNETGLSLAEVVRACCGYVEGIEIREEHRQRVGGEEI